MPGHMTRLTLLRTLATRSYSSAQLSPVGGCSTYDVQNTTLPTKLVVSSAENDSPITRISVIYRAGARNETQDNLGVTHVLRIAAGLSTKNATQFSITRNIQQVGASLHCTADRETISYTLEGTRGAIEKVLPFLTEVATQQVFKPWELADQINRLKIEITNRPPQLRAIDLLHKAAFRTGLGNSLFIPKHHLGKISSETLQHYVKSNFQSGKAAVVGLGVDHAQLVQYATCLEIENGDSASPPSAYKGGEIRSDKGGDLAYVAIAGEGAGVKNQKEALAFAVLQRAMGGAPSVKWSFADNGLLAKATNIQHGQAINTINASYAETGLFGAIIAAPAESAGKMVEAAVKALKSGRVTDEDVKRGKAQLKTTVLLAGESGRSAIRKIGTSAVLTGNGLAPTKYAEAIEAITTADVTSALQKVSRGKLSIASVGNLKTVPFLDELK